MYEPNAKVQSALKKLKAIDKSKLTPSRRIDLEETIEDVRHHLYDYQGNKQ